MTVVNTVGAEGQNVPITIPDNRGGTSPIGTSSPNSGSTAATNSTYAPGAFTSGISEPSVTTYTLNNTDYQGIVIFNTASAITVTLNQTVATNFVTSILNLGSGAITLIPNGGLLVNGAASLTLASAQGVQVFFANRGWVAFVGSTIIPVVPATISAVSGEYLTGYDATSGLFSKSTPAGISATITTAALTALGTQGSLVFVNGILTAQMPAT